MKETTKGNEMSLGSAKPILIIIAVLAALGLMVQSCSGGPAYMTVKEPTKALAGILDSYKDAEGAAITFVMEEMPSDNLHNLGMTQNELGKAMLVGFDATVDDVTFNDGKTDADAIVTLRSKDLSKVAGLIAETVNSVPSQLASASKEEITAWIDQQVLAKIEALPVIEHAPVTVKVDRIVSRWDVFPASQQILAAALFSGAA